MKRRMAGILLVCSVVLLSISSYFLIDMSIQERADNVLQAQLKEIYEGNKEDKESWWEDVECVENPSEIQKVNEGLLALHEENPDCIGWLTIEGTKIDYPVMYHPEEENYYLKRDFYGKYSANGSLFISELCNPENCDNLIIYGHHMKSGKMFAALEDYKKIEFYQDHPLIFYSTLHGDEVYQIFAVFCTSVYTENDFVYYAFTKADSKEEYNAYVSAVKDRSLYSTGISAVYGDKLLTVSTCEYSQKNGRIVVVAKKVEKDVKSVMQIDKGVENYAGERI